MHLYSSSPICLRVSDRGRSTLEGKESSAYLRREVESQVAVTGEIELDKEWDLVRQADLDLAGERCCFAEVHEVLQRKCEGHRLGELDLDAQVWLVYVGVLPDGNGSVADVSLGRKLDAILVGVDRN